MGILKKIFSKQKPSIDTKQTSDTEPAPNQRSDVNLKLKEIVNVTVGNQAQINSNSTLDDLGLDSLDAIEIIMAVEEEFDILIPDGEAEQLKCFGDAVKYLESRIEASSGEVSTNRTLPAPKSQTAPASTAATTSSATNEAAPTDSVSFSVTTDLDDITLASLAESAGETISFEGGPIEPFYERMSRDLISRHGPLVSVDYMSHFPKFEIWFAYEDGMRIYSGQRTGNYDVNFLSLGYVGEGPRYARHFLSAADFDLTTDQIASVRPGDSIEIKNDKATIVRKKDKVDEEDLGAVKFLHEREEVVFGAPATYRHYSAPDKEAAKKFLDKQDITAQSFFVVVETPEGVISKDRMGIFEE